MSYLIQQRFSYTFPPEVYTDTSSMHGVYHTLNNWKQVRYSKNNMDDQTEMFDIYGKVLGLIVNQE